MESSGEVLNGDCLIAEAVFVKEEEEDDDNADTTETFTTTRLYKCVFCGFMTSSKYSLKTHKKLHPMGRPPFKEWSNDLSIQLIEEYKKHEVIWNQKHSFYYSKAKKSAAWEAVVQSLNVTGLDVDEVQKKTNSLLSSFRREKAKIRKGVESGQSYVSKWFAFEHMQFLLDRSGTKINNTTLSDSEDSEDETESVVKDSDAVESEEMLFEDITAHLLDGQKRSLDVESSSNSKRQKKLTSSARPTSDLVYELMRKLSDPESVYAQHIAYKLRSYTPRTRAFVEHTISNILFEADMGKFDNLPNKHR